jgi:predicted acylesterase/phospholipase RssA
MDHALYFVCSPAPGAGRDADAALDAAARRASPTRARSVRWQVETSFPRTLAKLRAHGADALVIDARGETGPIEESTALGLLHALFAPHGPSSAIGREQTWLVVDPDARGAALAFEAGKARVAGTLAAPEGDESWREIWERIEHTVSRQGAGKIALCLAGGGIEGLFYELGAMRAFSYFLPEWHLSDADILCGISAGAILSAFLANGLDPRDIARGLKGEPGPIDPIGRWDIFDPNFRELGERAARLGWSALQGKVPPLSALFRMPPSGLFAGERLRAWLARQLEKPGMTDRFDRLGRTLYIGATDQDTGEHVVFGAPGATDLKISDAARASSALTPFYAPHRINGRYYVDGGFTRTTNMRVAVQAGATLVILVDPLVPVYSEQAGYVASRGAIFGAMQGLKSLIQARFDKAVSTLREMYPHVTFHLFQPSVGTMRVMSGSPMKYFYRTEIEELAFRETLREIRTHRFQSLVRDFGRHGVRFADPDAPQGTERLDLFDAMGDVRVA